MITIISKQILPADITQNEMQNSHLLILAIEQARAFVNV